MEWFLINVLSPLLLPVFLIVALSLIADVKPDTFVKIYLDLVQNLALGIYRVIVQLLKAIVFAITALVKFVLGLPPIDPEKRRRRKPELASCDQCQYHQRVEIIENEGV